MSGLFHTNSAASARSRRGRDRDNHHRANSISSSGRRLKEHLKNHENKSPPSKSPVLQPTLYAQQNLGLDQLPSLPSSQATSPTLSSTGTRSSVGGLDKNGVYRLSQQPYTPVALQQYLEKDSGDTEGAENNDLAETVHSSSQAYEAEEVALVESSAVSDQKFATAVAEDRDDRTPLANIDGADIVVKRVLEASRGGDYPQNSRGSSKRSRRRQSDLHYGIDQLSHSSRLSKQATNASDPGTQAENFHKAAAEVQDNTGEASLPDIRPPEPLENTAPSESNETRIIPHGSQSGPYQRQASSASISRKFTPPAQLRPTDTSPALPHFASPVPLRGRPTNQQYIGYQQPSGYAVQHPANMSQSYYQGYPNTPYYTGFGAPHSGQTSNDTRHSDLSTSANSVDYDKRGHSELSGSELIDDTIGLLYRLHETLPQMRMLVTSGQLTGSTKASTTNKTEVDDGLLAALKEKDARMKVLLNDLDEGKKRHFGESETLRNDLRSLENKCADLQAELLSRKRSRDTIDFEFKAFKQEIADTRVKVQEEAFAKVKDNESRMNALTFNIQEKSEEVLGLRQKMSEFEMERSREKQTADAFSAQRLIELGLVHQKERGELETLLKVEQDELSTLRKEKSSIEQHWKAINEAQRKEHQDALQTTKASCESSLSERQNRCEALEAENERLRLENKRMEDAWNNDKARFSKMAREFRGVATRLNEQKVR